MSPGGMGDLHSLRWEQEVGLHPAALQHLSPPNTGSPSLNHRTKNGSGWQRVLRPTSPTSIPPSPYPLIESIALGRTTKANHQPITCAHQAASLTNPSPNSVCRPTALLLMLVYRSNPCFPSTKSCTQLPVPSQNW